MSPRAMTSGGFASSTMPCSSSGGIAAETGCGTAPAFQQAMHASTNSTLLGRPMVTRSPRTTPRASRARASRLVRRSSSVQLRVVSPLMTAGASPYSAVSWAIRSPMGTAGGGSSTGPGAGTVSVIGCLHGAGGPVAHPRAA